MQQQWNEMKKEAGDCILFFQVGDFFEMFGDDAVEASDILEIALTSRHKEKNAQPMCGFPMRAAEKYVAKLTRNGKKVAIVEQTTLPGKTKIVERKITRIVTPGTTFSDQVLESGMSNFIAALYSVEETIAVAFAELSTGECFVQNFQNITDAVKEMSLRSVAEVLLIPEQFKKYSENFNYFSGVLSRHFMPDNTEKYLKQFFRVQTLKAFNIENNFSAISATALLCSFLEETQKIELSYFSGVSYKTNTDVLKLDIDTIKNLEIFASSSGDKNNGLFKHINNTKTVMGSRMLQERMIQPFAQKEKIIAEYNTIEELLQFENLLEEVIHSFKNVSDVERIIARISTQRASISDFVLLQKSIEEIDILTQKIDTIVLENTSSKQLEMWIEWNNYCKKLING
ncbi:TPA: hypothetical protein EYG84_01380 [Candidatus Gracilibacteria bacterium]|nr:hypothetical protein [Candidatus Gracilibacteria bacterium]